MISIIRTGPAEGRVDDKALQGDMGSLLAYGICPRATPVIRCPLRGTRRLIVDCMLRCHEWSPTRRGANGSVHVSPSRLTLPRRRLVGHKLTILGSDRPFPSHTTRTC